MISLEREKRIIFKPGVNLHVEVYLSMILLELGFLARITQALIILGGCKDVGVFSELSKDKLMVELARKRIGQIDQTHEREEALTRVAAHGTALPASQPSTRAGCQPVLR